MDSVPEPVVSSVRRAGRYWPDVEGCVIVKPVPTVLAPVAGEPPRAELKSRLKPGALPTWEHARVEYGAQPEAAFATTGVTSAAVTAVTVSTPSRRLARGPVPVVRRCLPCMCFPQASCSGMDGMGRTPALPLALSREAPLPLA